MYESPVNVIYGEMQMQIEADIFKAIQNVGIDVNKEELTKALQYDRGQYEKGYKDGYENAIDKFAELVIEAFTYIPKKYVMALAEELKAENANGWIPCSSGNFSTSEVLVCKEDGTIDFDVFDFMNEDWKYNSNHHKNKVLAWMPLPAPYQPKGKENEQNNNH